MNQRLLFLILIGLGGGISIIIADELAEQSYKDNSEFLPVARSENISAAGNKTAKLDNIHAWMDTALTRPLFDKDRRPPAAVPTTPTAPIETVAPTNDPLPRLAGIMISSNGKLAMFQSADSGAKSLIVSEGDQIGVWKVSGIDETGVLLEGPNGKQRVEPKADTNGVGGAAVNANNTILPTQFPPVGMPRSGASVPNMPGMPQFKSRMPLIINPSMAHSNAGHYTGPTPGGAYAVPQKQ